jgi:hypothetical protein
LSLPWFRSAKRVNLPNAVCQSKPGSAQS